MKIPAGRGTLPLSILIAIWSVAALNALPGLAVSPILGRLATVFPHATELDIQLLSSLPSLLVIPFILLSGKLTERVNNLLLLRTGLWIFLLSGVLYLLSDRMGQLIAVSALLGVGSGLIVPLSTGLVSRYFTGKYRTRQFGYSSAVTNLTLVLATALTGYLAEISWHLPFVVYLFPAVSLLLSCFLHGGVPAASEDDTPSAASAAALSSRFGPSGIDWRRLVAVMAFYGAVTYLVLVVTFDLPFLMEEYGFDSGRSGFLLSLFFLAIMAPGWVMERLVRCLGRTAKLWSLGAVAVGLMLLLHSRSEAVMAFGVLCMGGGYGVIQPLIYDQTSRLAVPRKATFALALVMVMNYVAILACPFVLDWARHLFHASGGQFPFRFHLVLTLLLLAGCLLGRHAALFDDYVES